jgi:hypothetical protein
MKVDWDMIQRIHRMLKECPDKEKEYKALYPEAFKETNITDYVVCRLKGYLQISFIGTPVGKVWFQRRYVYLKKNDEEVKTKIQAWTSEVEPGFYICDGIGNEGIKIIKYGPGFDKEKKRQEADMDD